MRHDGAVTLATEPPTTPPRPRRAPLPSPGRRLRQAQLPLTWAGSLALAVAYLALGRGLDALLDGARPGPAVVAAALVGILLAATTAAAVPALGGRGQAREETGLRALVVRRLIDAGPGERSREHTGRLVSTATDGVERAAAYRATFLGPMIAAMTVPVLVVIVVAVTIDARSGALLAVAIPVVPVLVGGFQSAFRRVSTEYRAQARALAAAFLDAVQGLTTLRVLDAGRLRGVALAEQAEALRGRVMRLLAGNQLIILVTDLAFSLGFLALAAWLAMTRLDAGAITAGQALALVLLSTLLLEPLDRIGAFFYIGMGGIAAVREIRTLLADPAAGGAVPATPPTAPAPGAGPAPEPGPIPEPGPTPAAAQTSGPAVTRPAPAAAIALTGVTFAYPARGDEPPTPVLDGLDLVVGPAEHVALVGRSGGGKSTVVQLVQAFARPRDGRVVVAGLDTAVADPRAVRARVTVVAQTTYLFTGTVADNLRLAAPGADEDALWEALRAAHLADDVLAFPERLATRVGERGLALSGGQAQRLAIARAVLRPTPVLVLDEPTSQVDLASERAVLAALEPLKEGRAVLTISHRPTTVADADRMYLLDAGRAREVDPRAWADGGPR